MEVELTPKRDRTEYDRKLSWYLGQTHYQRVHWFAPSFSLRDRLRRVAREIHMDDFVKVAPLPPGLDYPPGVKANREPSRLDVAADVDAAARIYRCRAAGFTPRGMVDCMIAAVAWRHRASLLAQDVDLQRNAGQHVHSANTRRVFVVFEELCDIWDDIHGLGYGLVTREFLDFHETVLRKLLNAIVEWASALNDKELHSAAVAAEEAYTNAVDDFVARLNDE